MAKVLVVDDNAVNRDLVVTLLGYRGHSCVQAADGAHALALARTEQPDLVITDLLMPVMDGYELVQEIRADPILAATPVIFYTANYLQVEVAPIALALGVRHMVSKPINPLRLVQAVDDALIRYVPAPSRPPQAFHREHRRALSAKLVDKVEELEHAEAALRESEARFRSLTEFSPVGIFSVDVGGRIAYENPRLREICGASDVAATGDGWAALVHRDDRERWLDAVTRAMEQRSSHVDRIRLVRADGELRWVQVQIAPAVTQGELTVVGTVEDVTEMPKPNDSASRWRPGCVAPSDSTAWASCLRASRTTSTTCSR
jgi:two-component system, cell cycle sensor histidine kinase and response regulator CckA